MNHTLRSLLRNSIQAAFALAVLTMLFASPLSARAQFYKLHNADVAVGGTGQFTTLLTSSATNGAQQFTTGSAGFIGSLREHPVAWAGIELNYGYTHLSEKYTFPIAAFGNSIFNDRFTGGVHEATGAYIFHPHFRHFQPFVNIGGGGLYFNPAGGPYQWRTAGLLETGFDLPTKNPHFGFRVQGRTLIYRAPNFYQSAISTRSWVSTEEPSLSAYIRF